jgi:hypothetical protein
LKIQKWKLRLISRIKRSQKIQTSHLKISSKFQSDFSRQ